MTEQETRTLISQLNNRSWALRTATRATFTARNANLQTAIQAAFQAQGRGEIPRALQGTLTTALANASNASLDEAGRYQRGLEPSQSPNASAAAAAAAQLQAGNTRSQQPPVLTGGGSNVAAVPETTTAETNKDLTPTEHTDESWAERNLKWELSTGQQGGIMNWLNPSDRNIYMRPWFLLAAAAAVGVIGYSIYSMYGEDR